MNYQYLIVTVEDGIGIVTFHRPEALNALNSAVLEELDRAVDELAADESVRVIVFTGEGKSFISGADIDELANSRGIQVINYSKKGCGIFRKIELLSKPTIAAVNGYAFGGGFEFLLCCDIRIANEKASFAMPEVTLGIVPGFNGTQRLPRAIGIAQAKELLFTGRRIKADEALALGAINKVVPLDTFWQEVMAEAQMIANNSSTAIYLVKSAVNAGIDAAFDVAKEVEVGYMAACFGTEDQIEGLTSFQEKRKPCFRGKE
ncbi:MAG: enoyl-CoA hydratase/isomerase family protein [Clostridiaceae bacterium]|nr:enoyl-CoA hydratase/isomerase family protein [Clostridiaceae bacterium]